VQITSRQHDQRIGIGIIVQQQAGVAPDAVQVIGVVGAVYPWAALAKATRRGCQLLSKLFIVLPECRRFLSDHTGSAGLVQEKAVAEIINVLQ
jgi:hypothetical protein